MIAEQFVLRKIPTECVNGIMSGEYKLTGGGIYGAKGMVKHLQFADDAGLQDAVGLISAGPLGSTGAAIGQLQALATASVALSGLNLAVSIAGFAIVCHKLNRIAAKLEEMNSKLDQLLAGQARIEWRQELERHARTVAAVENVALGLRTGRQALVEDAIPRLTESSVVYRRIGSALLDDVPRAYCDPLPFQQAMQQAIGCDLTKAQALAHLGHFPEAVEVVEASRHWHLSQLSRIERPMANSPVWLGMLSDSQAHSARNFMQEQRSIRPALDYATAQFRVCQMAGLRLDELASLPGDAPYVVISMDELQGKGSA